MPANADETVSETNGSPPKQFSKVRLFQIVGLLSRKFNHETSEFEYFLPFRLIFYLGLFFKIWTIKFVISYYFPRNHIAQLYLGSFFNYLPGGSRFFMGWAGVMSGIWNLFYHFVFNYLNAKNDYRLFRFWMKLTLELPVKSDGDYRVTGLPTEENKKFWLTENHVNYVWFRVINYYCIALSLIFSSQLFFVRFDGVEILSVTYFLFQAIHIFYIYFCVFSFMHCFYSLNLFYMTCMRHFSKRFNYIGKHVKTVRFSELVDNRKLSRLIIDHNRVHADLFLINDFFKAYVGFNLISFFAFEIVMVFVVLLDIDWKFKLAISSVCLFLYLSVIYFPFIMSKSVTNEINMATRQFEKIAFHRSVNRTVRQKIESISNLSTKAGFTCFSWFKLDPHTGLRITLEFVVSLLLFIQAYYYYNNI